MNENSSGEPQASSAETGVTGVIEFQDVQEPVHDATVYVRVQDVGLADAAAKTVAEEVIRNVNIVPGGAPLSFNVRGIRPTANARYAVRVHADVSGNGRVTPGDYVSTQSYPVNLSEQPAKVDIVTRRVGPR
jgi:uncharacterized lipoprotein YbaY